MLHHGLKRVMITQIIPKTYVESYFHQLKNSRQDILKAECSTLQDSNAADGNSQKTVHAT